MDRKQRILITGAGGWIGNALLEKLQYLSPMAAYRHSKPLVEYSQLKKLDLRDEHMVEKLMKEYKPQVVYHLAALSSPSRNETNPELAKEMHCKVTENIVRNLPRGAHIVFTSTDKVFDGLDPNPDENSPPRPQWLYAQLKVQCENLVRRVPRHHIFRLGIVHSMGEQWESSPAPVASRKLSFIDKGLAEIKAAKRVKVFNNVARCYVRLSRLTELFEAVLEDGHYGLYHVGSPIMTYYERIKQLCMELGLDWKNFLVGSHGETVPMTQNMNTAKLKATFKVIFD